ncbi:MAG TPA: RHS repeat-associated core domain-containing protein [Verrucomicrobiae bacterium]|nr:RHS repeat-associated core domain-containing protein [Verrucomicrobiae bacterium]
MPVYTLGYSPAHQLTSEGSSDPTYLLQLASTGTDTYSAPNSLNQVTTINGASASGHDCQGNAQQYSYDCNGNLTGDGTWSYAYDPENRLITAGKTSGGTVSATYAYDPLGRRTHKSGTGVTETYFLSDGSDEIAEYSSSGTGTWRYIPGPAINEPIATINASTGARKYFQTDHHGSVIAIVSNGGNELEGPYTYDAYGNCFTAGAACSTSGTPYRFTGMRLDPETGLYYDRARYYSAAIGGFLQTDGLKATADLDLYSYSSNDPVNRGDPTGLTSCSTGSRLSGNYVECNFLEGFLPSEDKGGASAPESRNTDTQKSGDIVASNFPPIEKKFPEVPQIRKNQCVGYALELCEAAALKALGFTVVFYVNYRDPASGLVTNLDITAYKEEETPGQGIGVTYYFKEVKAGNARLRVNQAIVFRAIENGTAIPFGPLAAEAGLEPNVSLSAQGIPVVTDKDVQGFHDRKK